MNGFLTAFSGIDFDRVVGIDGRENHREWVKNALL
jgi:hypothetical protein